MRFANRAALLIGCLLALACSEHAITGPSAPGSAAAPVTVPAPPPTSPPAAAPLQTYVVIGDSLGLDDALYAPYWPAIKATIGGQWQHFAMGSTFLHTDWQPTGKAYAALIEGLTRPPTAFLMHVGANDTILHEYKPHQITEFERPTQASVFTDLSRFSAAMARDYPGVPIYLADVGQVWTYGDMRAENAAVRAGINQGWASLPNLRRGPDLRDLMPDDGVHFNGAANAAIIAARWIQVLR